MTFHRYESRPITRLAHELTEQDIVVSRPSLPDNYKLLVTVDGNRFEFSHLENIHTGDFVVFHDIDDVYHCPRDVFLAENVVPEDELLHDDAAEALEELSDEIYQAALLVGKALDALEEEEEADEEDEEEECLCSDCILEELIERAIVEDVVVSVVEIEPGVAGLQFA